MRPDQLAIQDPPRIVKLHGSLPAQFPLVFTEEDYRRYPSKFAAFVNTVQQAMLETVLVLVGFSGDDPNFQRWLGWVRDNLRGSAPKIYLAGWLDLPDHERRRLEGQNVVPIDLARCPEAQQWSRRHESAIRWFLQELHRGRPYPAEEWPKCIDGHLSEHTPMQETALRRTGKPASGSEVKDLLGIWAHNRRLYPGWLALPFASSHGVSDRTDEWEGPILQDLSALRDGVERVIALRELVWRREVLLDRLSPDLAEAVEKVLVEVDCVERRGGEPERTDDEWLRAGRTWRALALAMVTDARYERDRKKFDRWIRELSDVGNEEPDVQQRLHHERCLWAIARENYDSLDELLEDWEADRKEHDPAWLMRKASILALVGRAAAAEELVEGALDRVRSWPKRSGSLGGQARESWLLGHWFSVKPDRSERYLYLTQTVWPRWRALAPCRCDPGSEVASYLRSMRPSDGDSVPSFDLAVRPQEVPQSAWRARNRLRQAYRTVRLTEIVGFGQSFPGGERLLTMAADILGASEPFLSASLSIRSATYDQDSTYKAALSRRRVASMQVAEAEELAGNQLAVIKFALARLRAVGGRRLFWCERFRVALETVSRLVPRLQESKVEEILSRSLELYEDRGVRDDVWFAEPLGHLVSRSWEALGPTRRKARALDLLNAPIVGVRGFDVHVPAEYRDPVGAVRRSRQLMPRRTAQNNAQWGETVALLEEAMGKTGEPRKRAALRAARLTRAGGLTLTEKARLGEALWGPDWEGSLTLPEGTGLAAWTVLLFGEPEEGLAEERLRADWFGVVDWRVQEDEKLSELFDGVGFGLASLEKQGRDFPLSDLEARSLSVAVQAWAEGPQVGISLSISSNAVSGLARILLRIRVPEELGSELVQRVLGRSNLIETERARRRGEDSSRAFFRRAVLHEALTFLHELVPGLSISCPSQREPLIECLHTGLASGDFDELLSAARAVYLWLEETRRAGTRLEPPPDALIREVGLVIGSRRRGALANVLEIAEWVFIFGTQKHRDLIRRLVLDGLAHLARDLAYGVPSQEEEAIEFGSDSADLDVPLLRLRCVQVAVAMANAGLHEEPVVEKWLSEAEQDPMAEVRLVVEEWRRAAENNGDEEVVPET